ncbi:LAFE_0D11870g1_1 [Lachancea fermentati]|uniref:LAFE_0D11870g1_1 n=1 Tax=Lachancea fermentati TaxID=4955 RepID=A0A1G4MC52_LACFM|nr:LAFE_0D11870g1_1 [Lachancea fermentati]
MTIPFGYQFKQKYFTLLDPEVTLVNHGSYGTTPACVIERQKELCEAHEKYPDRFQAYEVEGEYRKQVELLGKYLNVDYHNLALVTNATTGVNLVLRSIPWNFSKDKVLFHSTTYGACGNTVKFLNKYFNLQYDVVDLEYPMEDAEVLRRFEEKLATGNYKLCLFDMITSMPGVKLPYEEIISLCKMYDTWSLLDGAHAAGQVDLDFIDRLQPDFLTTNLHKWLSVPKACGMLYVNPKHQGMVQSMPVSWNFGADVSVPIENPSSPQEEAHNRDIMLNKFWFIGTASYCQYLCIEEALRFRSEDCGGEENIRRYQYTLQKSAIKTIQKVFGPGAELLQNSTGTLNPPGLFNVSLPIEPKYQEILNRMANDFHYFRRVKFACDKKTIGVNKAYAPFQIHNGKLWVRFSVQIFNEVQDYEIGAKSVKSVVEDVFEKELRCQCKL